MTKGRVLKIAAAVLVVALACRAAPARAGETLAQVCARVGNDDTVQPYSPSLEAATARAFKTMFPRAKGALAKAAPDPTMWQTQANYRCMNGKIWVCFIGANLPCAKINTARNNPGADAFCREQPNADVVPAVATGHDAAYSYKCRDGHAEVDRANWQLDPRGFAKSLWIELPDRP